MIEREKLNSLLQLMGDLMDKEKTPSLRIVVSGGAALIAKEIVVRSTHDIDVFAQREWEGDLVPGHPLPEWFLELVERVAAIEDLDRNWINATTSLIGNGLEILPPSCFADLDELDFGNRLRVGFLNRDALIYLKAFAVLGRSEDRDEIDLLALKPNPIEMRKALDWIQSEELVDPIIVEQGKVKLEKCIDEG